MSREATEPGREERFHAVLAEYLHQVESNQAPDERDFMAQHAEFAQELGQFFADSTWFDTTALPLQTWCHASVRDTPAVDALSSPAADDVPPTTPSESDIALPHPGTRRFGNYELLEEIGCGGMGVVYRAKQLDLKRIVALKMILAGRFASREEVGRFRRGAAAAAHLQHPNIAQIHEVGEQEGLHYFTMDYVEGSSLAELVGEQGPLPPKQAARYIKKTAEAMHYAHQRGTYHRDLKPANVLIDENDEPQVTDFGLAKRLDDDPEMTKDTDFFGTASYMPPEQAAQQWKDVGPPSDIYSLGATLYYVLTGHPPFRGATVPDTLYQVIHNDPIPPRGFNRKISRDLEAIVLKCLEKSPQRRYATAAALADDLGRFLEGQPVVARRRSAAGSNPALGARRAAGRQANGPAVQQAFARPEVGAASDQFLLPRRAGSNCDDIPLVDRISKADQAPRRPARPRVLLRSDCPMAGSPIGEHLGTHSRDPIDRWLERQRPGSSGRQGRSGADTSRRQEPHGKGGPDRSPAVLRCGLRCRAREQQHQPDHRPSRQEDFLGAENPRHAGCRGQGPPGSRD